MLLNTLVRGARPGRVCCSTASRSRDASLAWGGERRPSGDGRRVGGPTDGYRPVLPLCSTPKSSTYSRTHMEQLATSRTAKTVPARIGTHSCQAPSRSCGRGSHKRTERLDKVLRHQIVPMPAQTKPQQIASRASITAQADFRSNRGFNGHQLVACAPPSQRFVVRTFERQRSKGHLSHRTRVFKSDGALAEQPGQHILDAKQDLDGKLFGFEKGSGRGGMG